ncbi:aspartate kinase [Endothiovibrio diazotrophicus]
MIDNPDAVIVCKFGGSSVANAAQIEKVRGIIQADPRRRIVVVSAPGKAKGDREKVTDHLINIATDGRHFHEMRKSISAEESREAVLRKFTSILHDLKLGGEPLLARLRADLSRDDLKGEPRIAFYASRGEHYNAQLIADHFRNHGLAARVGLPEEIGLEVRGEPLDAKIGPESHDRLAALADEEGIVVVPGFYGVSDEGEVAVMSRGGSDLTGGELAYAVDAEVYENWTDTNGIYEVDPRLIPESRVIPRLTFKEIRLLSSKGFNVFHFDAMLNCKKRKIPINIRNTNAPREPGTLILNERVPEEGVVGIAKLDNMAYIYLEKDSLGDEIGFTAGLLTIFQECGINTYHYPTDKDDIAVLVHQDDLKGSINELRRRIERRLNPDYMDVVYNQAILTPVGLGMKGNSHPIVDAITALGEARIPIKMMGQSPSQICFHIAVPQTAADAAIDVLYRRLIGMA